VYDLSGSEIEGRVVDEIGLEVYQILAGNKRHIVLHGASDADLIKIVPAAAATTSATTGAGSSTSSSVTRFGTGKGDLINFVWGTNARAVADRVVLKIAKGNYKYGYPIHVKIEYRSKADGVFAKTPALPGILEKSSADYFTAVNTLTFTTIPEDEHDEVGSMRKEDGDKKTTIHWSPPKDQYNRVLTGYVVDLYDISSGTVTPGATGSVSVNFSSPAAKKTSGILSASADTYEFGNLVNGKNYMAVIHTITTQGLVSVKSSGRSLHSTMLLNNEVIKQGYDTTFGSYVYFGDKDTGVSTVNHFAPVHCARPYGKPLIFTKLNDQVLTIDDNGTDILYAAMIQVQTTASATSSIGAAAATSSVGTASAAAGATSDNVFYLDLSLGTLLGVSAQENYKTLLGVGIPNRQVFNVKKEFLGEGWVDEKNYIFASNKAGTTVQVVDKTTVQTPPP
jgi:hypothetical protein